ncbi:MAG: hypothetical protein IT380_25320 [Myxococcales bacterium]|nr:hypothetical protein [Myxococcales bacterium]
MLAILALFACAAVPAPTAPGAPPRHVYVGTYLADVSDFDLKAGRFKADLHVWVKWRGAAAVPGLSFENGELDAKDELGEEHDGDWHSVRWRVQGTFRGEFPVHAFPFDVQTLPVAFGLDEEDGVLLPDLGASGMSPRFSVTGWDYEPYFSARAETRTYASDLGSVAQEGRRAQRRLAVFSVDLRRPFGPYLTKFALPLVLILLMALLALLLPPDRLDVRSALGITALLSCIAFHYTQSDTLPNVTYLIAADALFLGSYLFVAGTLVVSVLAFRGHERRPAAVRLMDRTALWVLPGVTAVGLALISASALSREVDSEPAAPVNPHASQPVLRVAVPALDTPASPQLPARRGALVTRGSDGAFVPVLAQEAPAMTNALVRLLPDGGMRVRWRLRADARWSDGTPITADDLAFSVATMNEPLRRAVERVDERTLDVEYSERRSAWLSGFTVYPKAAGQQLDAGREELFRATNDGTLPSGGPFTVGEFVPKQRLTLVRNERFAGMKPVFERVEARVLEPLEAARALLAGEVDVVPSLSPDAYELLKDAPEVRVLEQPGELLWVLVPNLAKAPWDSLDARRALLATLDRHALVDTLAPAPARVASGWKASAAQVLPAAPSLAAVGLAGATVTLNVATIHSKDETHAQLAQRLVQELAKAGVTVEVVEHAELRQVVQGGAFDGLALMSRDTSDPSRFVRVGSRSTAPTGPPPDAALGALLERLLASLYDERRDALEASLQRAWVEKLPMLPLVLTSRLAAVRTGLVGPDWGRADSLWWNVTTWHFGP